MTASVQTLRHDFDAQRRIMLANNNARIEQKFRLARLAGTEVEAQRRIRLNEARQQSERRFASLR